MPLPVVSCPLRLTRSPPKCYSFRRPSRCTSHRASCREKRRITHDTTRDATHDARCVSCDLCPTQCLYGAPVYYNKLSFQVSFWWENTKMVHRQTSCSVSSSVFYFLREKTFYSGLPFAGYYEVILFVCIWPISLFVIVTG